MVGGAACRRIAQHPALLPHGGAFLGLNRKGGGLASGVPATGATRRRMARSILSGRTCLPQLLLQDRVLVRTVINVSVSDELCTPRVLPVELCAITVVRADNDKGGRL